MPKNNFEQSDTGNWNVAAKFTDVKIMNWLAKADDMEVVAIFGVYDFEDEFQIDEQLKKIARIRALKRLRHILDMVVNNTKFAIRKKEDKETFTKYLETLKKIKDTMGCVEDKKTIRNKTIIDIHEKNFSQYLDILVQMKAEINEPLNRADLIFTHREEFDPKKAKQDMLKNLAEEG